MSDKKKNEKPRKNLNVLIDADTLKTTGAFIEALGLERGAAIEEALKDWAVKKRPEAMRALGLEPRG